MLSASPQDMLGEHAVRKGAGQTADAVHITAGQTWERMLSARLQDRLRKDAVCIAAGHAGRMVSARLQDRLRVRMLST